MKFSINSITGEIIIWGESNLIYSTEVYAPIFEFLDKHLSEKYNAVTLYFKVTSFNTSSARRFIEILTILEDYQNDMEGKVSINWYFEQGNLEMKEAGVEFQEDIDMPFHLIELPKREL